MGYKILKTVKLGKKVLGHIKRLDSGDEAFVSVRKNRDHIYMGGNPIAFTDAEKEGKLEWAINEKEMLKMATDGVKFVIIESGYYSQIFVTHLANFSNLTIAKRFRHYDSLGNPLDYQRSLGFRHFITKKVKVSKL